MDFKFNHQFKFSIQFSIFRRRQKDPDRDLQLFGPFEAAAFVGRAEVPPHLQDGQRGRKTC